MILVDANLLLYAYIQDYAEHPAANRWLEGVLHGTDRVGLPWESTLAFARIVTDRRLYVDPPSIGEAWAQVRRWLSAPVAWVPGPTPDHLSLLDRLLATPGLGRNDIPDAQLAAIALGHGLEVTSHDAGFARFEGLRWSDPIRT